MRDGRLSITTPEGVRLLLTPAGPVPRAWAWLIDFLIYLGTLLLLIWIFSLAVSSGAGRWVVGIYLALLFGLYWGYPMVCEVYFGGRTIGKRLLGLQVVRADGLPVGWRESMLRNLLLVADFLPLFYASGLVAMLFDKRFRRIGDMVAGTQVVYTEPAVLRRQRSTVEPAAPLFALTVAQQRSLIDLVERAPSIPPERLLELATLAQPITGQQGKASLERLRAIVAGFQ